VTIAAQILEEYPAISESQRAVISHDARANHFMLDDGWRSLAEPSPISAERNDGAWRELR
jgi:hypothetical protein